MLEKSEGVINYNEPRVPPYLPLNSTVVRLMFINKDIVLNMSIATACP